MIYILILSTIVHGYLFVLQRAALEICRVNGINPGLRIFIIPAYYPMAVWITFSARWASLAYFLWHGEWLITIIALTASSLFAIFFPIPHLRLITKYIRALERRMRTSLDPQVMRLFVMCLAIKERGVLEVYPNDPASIRAQFNSADQPPNDQL